MKLERGSTLIIASHNPGKVREIRDLLESFGLFVRGAAELGLSEPDETGSSFADNALLKARAAAKASGHAALADDSGLAVAELGGAPGVYSARWAGEEKDFISAMARVERELKAKGARDFSAKFVCALAIAEPGDDAMVFEGEVLGHLVFPPRGGNGFGYDPIFVADGMCETFGQIAPAIKHGISHRGRAFKKLVDSAVLER